MLQDQISKSALATNQNNITRYSPTLNTNNLLSSNVNNFGSQNAPGANGGNQATPSSYTVRYGAVVEGIAANCAASNSLNITTDDTFCQATKVTGVASLDSNNYFFAYGDRYINVNVTNGNDTGIVYSGGCTTCPTPAPTATPTPTPTATPTATPTPTPTATPIPCPSIRYGLVISGSAAACNANNSINVTYNNPDFCHSTQVYGVAALPSGNYFFVCNNQTINVSVTGSNPTGSVYSAGCELCPQAPTPTPTPTATPTATPTPTPTPTPATFSGRYGLITAGLSAACNSGNHLNVTISGNANPLTWCNASYIHGVASLPSGNYFFIDAGQVISVNVTQGNNTGTVFSGGCGSCI
jgi:Fe-S cluster biogenesis protein NfuA